MDITTVIEPTTVDPTAEEGDHDRFTHIVPTNQLADSMINGIPIRALCGKMWVPSRDPDRYPVCKMCIDVYEHKIGPYMGRR